MNPVDRYIDDVLRHVFASGTDRRRLETDLRAHFAEAEESGRGQREIIDGLGEPREVAAAFNADRPITHAGFFRRLVAFIGDVGMLIALALPALAIAALFGVTANYGDTEAPVGVIVAAVFVATSVFGAVVFYFPLLEARFGKTLGKHLMGIRVIREDGSAIGLGQAFVRRLSFYFEMLVIDALFIPFTDKRQRALDIVAKTIVAREPGIEERWWGWAACLLLPLLSGLALAAMAVLCGVS